MKSINLRVLAYALLLTSLTVTGVFVFNSFFTNATLVWTLSLGWGFLLAFLGEAFSSSYHGEKILWQGKE